MITKRDWPTCPRGDWMLIYYAKTHPENKRELSLAKGLCANTVRHLLTDPRSLAAIDNAIAYGRGETEYVNETDDISISYPPLAYAVINSGAAITIMIVTIAAYVMAAPAVYVMAASYVMAAFYIVYATMAVIKKNRLDTANICREVLKL